jgi:uncharacterized membrane protein
MERRMNEYLRDLIAPLGLMFLLIPLMQWLVIKGGNEGMLGILMLYICYVITYFAFIQPRFKRYTEIIKNTRIEKSS